MDDRTIQIILFHQSAEQGMEKRDIVTHFTTKIHTYVPVHKL